MLTNPVLKPTSQPPHLRSAQGLLLIICPRCRTAHSSHPIEITVLNEWAFKDGIAVDFDARGCCLEH